MKYSNIRKSDRLWKIIGEEGVREEWERREEEGNRI